MSSSTNGVSDFVKRTLNDIKEMSTLNQILVGGTAGLTTGYIFSRVGKLAAFTIGSGVLLLQVAQHMGYIEVKWKKNSKLDDLKKKAIKAAEEAGLTNGAKNGKLEQSLQEVKYFLQDNFTFGISFAGGALIGFSF